MNYNFTNKHKYSSAVLPESLKHLESEKQIIKNVNLNHIFCRLVDGIQPNGKVVHKISRLKDTPHWKYIKGNKKPYINYLRKFGLYVGYGIEHSSSNFDKLISHEFKYLSGNFSKNYIVCEEVKWLIISRIVILDGLHRACILLSKDTKHIPVVIIKT
jgi:hypothetical protein